MFEVDFIRNDSSLRGTFLNVSPEDAMKLVDKLYHFGIVGDNIYVISNETGEIILDIIIR